MRTFRSTLPTGSPGLPVFSWLMTGLALSLYLLAGAAPSELVFDRYAVQEGEWWRLITGHFVHSDGSHAFWDILLFFLIGHSLERRHARLIISGCLLGILAIDAWLWWGLPELLRYCGLSGLINTLLPLLLLHMWRQSSDPIPLLVGCGYLIKLGWEASTGTALFTTTEWPSVPSVHVIGMIAAVPLMALPLAYRSTPTSAAERRALYPHPADASGRPPSHSTAPAP